MSQHARKSSSKDPGSKPSGTKHDATYLRAKISFMKSHDLNNVSIAKEAGPSLDSGFGLLASSTRTRPTQHSAPRGGVVRLESVIKAAACIAGGREA